MKTLEELETQRNETIQKAWDAFKRKVEPTRKLAEEAAIAHAAIHGPAMERYEKVFQKAWRAFETMKVRVEDEGKDESKDDA